MTADNLALVFGPNILSPEVNTDLFCFFFRSCLAYVRRTSQMPLGFFVHVRNPSRLNKERQSNNLLRNPVRLKMAGRLHERRSTFWWDHCVFPWHLTYSDSFASFFALANKSWFTVGLNLTKFKLCCCWPFVWKFCCSCKICQYFTNYNSSTFI